MPLAIFLEKAGTLNTINKASYKQIYFAIVVGEIFTSSAMEV